MSANQLIDSRKEVIDFLKDLQSYYGAYHHHKENMGWASVGLFAVLMAGLATVTRQPALQSSLTDNQRWGFSIVIGVIWSPLTRLRLRPTRHAVRVDSLCLVGLRRSLVANWDISVDCGG